MKIPLSLVCLAILLVPSLSVRSVAQNAPAFTGAAKPEIGASPTTDINNLPLSFEANQGQSDSRVKYLSRGDGYSLFLTDSAAVLALSKADPSIVEREREPHIAKRSKVDVIWLELAGTGTGLRVSGAEELPGKANYFIGNDPAEWRAGVSTYAKVKYQNVYPGVDLVYYGNQRQLEYDFVVSANADPKTLRLRFEGVQHLSLTPSGDLTINGKNGEIAFRKPVVYQMRNGVRESVAGRFQLVGGNSVRFAVGSYDHARALIIDPVLAYSTYLGGSGGDSGNAITVDAAGDFYVVGGTTSPDFPVTTDAFQKVNNGMAFDNGFYENNVFVTKFNPRGSALIYSTYLGGTTNDETPPGTYVGDVATGIAIDAAGDAYVTGYASSYNFPVTRNAYQKVNKTYGSGTFYSNPVGNNAFVTKLSPTGSALIYSTYFGGSGAFSDTGEQYYGDTPVGIAIDPAGNAYIAGTTGSADLPVTSNAFQKVNKAGGGALNVFITKFNSAGSGLIYSTYLGGSGFFDGRNLDADTAGGIVIDSAGDAYVTGTSYSSDFPVTADAYQKVNKANHSPDWSGSNAIITELNPGGSALVYSTYLGGSETDTGNSIALDATGNAYVVGSTTSADFPTTRGAFQRTFQIDTQGYGKHAFLTQIDSTGSALVYSSFLGGNGIDVANSIALDAFGSTYVTGTTTSTDFPVTSDAYRKANHSPVYGNAFVSKLDPKGASLLYSTYLGGSATQGGGFGDSGNGIAVDWFGQPYVTGRTCSTDFPLASVPFQGKNKGTGCTAFVSKFIINTVTGTKLTSNGNPQRAGVQVTFTADVAPQTGTSMPTGSVVFSVDGTPQVTDPLDDTGHASYSTASLAQGRHVVTARYLGNATTSGSSGDVGQTIIGPPARITVRSGSDQTTTKGSPFSLPLVVQVQDSNGRLVPDTVVTFRGSGLSFSSDPVVTGSNGEASVVATATAVGNLTATASVSGVSTTATFRLIAD